jgi:hypothetical protein
MKKTLIIGHNSLSAGTASQTLNFTRFLIENEKTNYYFITLPNKNEFYDLKGTKNVDLKIIKYNDSLFGLIKRIIYELIYFPILIKKIKPSSILALSNYFYIPFVRSYKIALLRHPYIVDKTLITQLNFKSKIREFFRRQFFILTLINVDHLIVQSDYMKKQFQANYSFNKTITILPNPVDVSNFPSEDHLNVDFDKKENIMFYPSRYYPHKNFEYIFKTVYENLDFFISYQIKVYLTLAEKIYNDLLSNFKGTDLSEVIINIGEVPQKELSRHYQRSKLLFFPSVAETFGNALVEGLYFRIPILVPKLPYAVSICEDAGNYFDFDNNQQTIDIIEKIISNKDFWLQRSKLSEKQFKKFLYLDQWTKSVLNLL